MLSPLDRENFDAALGSARLAQVLCRQGAEVLSHPLSVT